MATIKVNPEILRWARETAGLTIEDAAHKLQISAARGMTPFERLDALETGIDHPTRPLLQKMSKSYRRPLLVFYLEAPPTRGNRGEDFRHLPDHVSPTQEGIVDALVRDVKSRQRILRSVLEEEDEAVPLPFVSSMTMEIGVNAVSESISQYLKFDLSKFREQRNAADAFSYLRDLVETSGVFVLLIGDLGSHHSQLSVDYFRGFALADTSAPFIVINDQDAKSAWSFTLLHELAHIFIGREGVSAAAIESGVEQFCNDVAAALLLGNEDFRDLDISNNTALEDAVALINTVSYKLNISMSMIAYQLFRRGLVGREMWQTLQREFRRLWLESKESERKAARGRTGGPDYYVVRRYRSGHALIDLVSRMTRSGVLTTTKAGKVLGVKPRNVYDLIGLGA